jgi:hypothetical protein
VHLRSPHVTPSHPLKRISHHRNPELHDLKPNEFPSMETATFVGHRQPAATTLSSRPGTSYRPVDHPHDDTAASGYRMRSTKTSPWTAPTGDFSESTSRCEETQELSPLGSTVGGGLTQDRFADDPLHGEAKLWYFGEIDRQQATQRLDDLITEDGAFLVRRKHGPGKLSDVDVPYILSIVHDRSVRHVCIRRSWNHLYTIGSKEPTSKMFTSVSELINFYRHNDMQLTVARDVKTTRLTKYPHK